MTLRCRARRPNPLRTIALTGLWVALGAAATAAQASDRAARRAARDFRKMEVPGDEVRQQVDRLQRELRWHRTLAGALEAARRADKPVFWVQALGDLDGFL